jgi:hypothetical protein
MLTLSSTRYLYGYSELSFHPLAPHSPAQPHAIVFTSRVHEWLMARLHRRILGGGDNCDALLFRASGTLTPKCYTFILNKATRQNTHPKNGDCTIRYILVIRVICDIIRTLIKLTKFEAM